MIKYTPLKATGKPLDWSTYTWVCLRVMASQNQKRHSLCSLHAELDELCLETPPPSPESSGLRYWKKKPWHPVKHLWRLHCYNFRVHASSHVTQVYDQRVSRNPTNHVSLLPTFSNFQLPHRVTKHHTLKRWCNPPNCVRTWLPKTDSCDLVGRRPRIQRF